MFSKIPEPRRCRRSEGPIFGNAPRPLHQDRQVSYALTSSGQCTGCAAGRPRQWNTVAAMASRDSAVRAVLTGQPFDMLKPEHYESWKELELTFDPKDM